MRLLHSILSQGAFIMYNKEVAKKTSVNEALVLADLISKHKYFYERSKLGTDGSFFNTYENISDDTALSEKQIRLAVSKLKTRGLLSTVRKGIPAKTFYIIDTDAIMALLVDEEDLIQLGHSRSDQRSGQEVTKGKDKNLPKGSCINKSKNKNKNNSKVTTTLGTSATPGKGVGLRGSDYETTIKPLYGEVGNTRVDGFVYSKEAMALYNSFSPEEVSDLVVFIKRMLKYDKGIDSLPYDLWSISLLKSYTNFTILGTPLPMPNGYLDKLVEKRRWV